MNEQRENIGDAEMRVSGPATGSFEESLARLEAIARDLEEGELGLDAALARYQEGVAQLRYCRKMLQHAERKIELLVGVTETGEAITSPFDDGPTHEPTGSAVEAPSSRAKRRSAPKARRSATVVGDSTVGQSSVDPQRVNRADVAPSEVDVDSPKRLF